MFLVFDILLTYMKEKDWGKALKKNIPERKGWVIKKSEEGREIFFFVLYIYSFLNLDSNDNKVDVV